MESLGKQLVFKAWHGILTKERRTGSDCAGTLGQ